MIKSFLSVLIAVLLSSIAAVAAADVGVDAKVGTLGIGVEVVGGITDKLSLGLGLNSFSTTTSQTSHDVDYDFKAKLESVTLLANYHPFTGIFRLTAGLVIDNNKISMTGKPSSSGNFTFNGHEYTTAEVGTLSGDLTFNKEAPYLGIGWGNRPNSRWGVVADLGVVYQGSPKLALSASGAATDPSLASDLEQERRQEESDLRKYKWWPVVSAGLYYHF